MKCLFGDVINQKMKLNQYGLIVQEWWEWLAKQYPYIELDIFRVMPNHIHGILIYKPITGDSFSTGASRPISAPPTCIDRPHPETNLPAGTGGSRTAPPIGIQRKPLGQIIGAFKTESTKHINTLRGTPGVVLWQRNYFDRIIWNEMQLYRTRKYILANEENWHRDRNNPDRKIE